MTLVLSLAALAYLLTALVPSHAVADSTVTECDILGVCHIVVVKDSDGEGGSRSAGRCSWQRQVVDCQQGSGTFDPASGCYQGPAERQPTDGPVLAQYKKYGGTILFATCPFGGTGGYIWQPPAKPVVTAELVRQQAVRLIPSAAVGVAPKGTTLVNIETVLWADAPPKQALPAVTLLGQRVVITLELDRVTWDFGDGQADSNAPAGKAYDARNDPCREKVCSHYYGHIYSRTGQVEITATAYWHATFTVDGGAGQDAGNVPGPRATADVTVKQARGVLVPNPGESP